MGGAQEALKLVGGAQEALMQHKSPPPPLAADEVDFLPLARSSCW